MFKKTVLFYFFFAVSVFAQAVGPVATVQQVDYNFTSVEPGSSMSHTFMIYNGGSKTLYLYKVSTSCKCITANLNKNKLVPTDSARLEVTYSPTSKSNTMDNYVSIKTNDPSNPNLRIYVTRANPNSGPTLASMPKDSSIGAEIGPRIYFPESDHNFGLIKSGAIVDYVFKFYNRGNSNLIIKNITTSCGCTAALVKEKDIPPGKEGELKIEFDSSGREGQLSRRITIFSNDVKEPVKAIMIYANVVRADK